MFSEQYQQLQDVPNKKLAGFLALLEPKSDNELKKMAQESAAITRRHFGKTMRLFAPLYLSNECINNCAYCGFSRDNPILRVTLSLEEVAKEADFLYREGFRSLLLVAGEHPKFVSNGYLEEIIINLLPRFPSIALEVAPLETEQYIPLVQAGAEGLVVYQETYDEEAYHAYHTAGPKKDFRWRLDAPERAYRAGFRRLGVGALFGLAEWRTEALGLAAHLLYLERHCWKAQLSVSLPRLRPAAGSFEPKTLFSDREMIQLLFALRITFPQLHLVMSTRESSELRDTMATLGVTMMSAGSHTEPGGYTGQGVEDLHQTIRGKRREIKRGCQNSPCSEVKGRPALQGSKEPQEVQKATEQFAISDERSPAEVAAMLAQQQLEPVWKDWEQSILKPL